MNNKEETLSQWSSENEKALGVAEIYADFPRLLRERNLIPPYLAEALGEDARLTIINCSAEPKGLLCMSYQNLRSGFWGSWGRATRRRSIKVVA